jgi:hypothetical protein
VTNSLAIASFVCAMIQLPYELILLGLLWLLGPGGRIQGAPVLFVLPVLAIACGAVGWARISARGGRGRRLATAGLWIGGLEILVLVLVLAVFLTHGYHLG